MTSKHDCSGKIWSRWGSNRIYRCSHNATIERDGEWWCWQHDPQRVEAERQLQLDAKTKARNHEARLTLEIGRSNELRRAYRLAERGRQRAEALAQLVTEELAALLARLGDFAICSRQGEKHDYQHWFDEPCSDDPGRALALAARIREALGVNDA